MIYANDNNFTELTKNGTVLVDFYATWCGPCMMIAEELDKLDKSRSGDYNIVKVNTDECPEMSKKFEIEAIPTLILMKNGEIIKRNVGYISAEEIQEMIN